MERTSKHYTEDRQYRENLMHELFGGQGEVVFERMMITERNSRHYWYQITENAVIIIRDANSGLIITKIFARPSRIKKIWNNPTEEVIKKAIANARDPRRCH